MLPTVEAIPMEDSQSFRYRLFAKRHFPFQWHMHPELELTWIVSGHGQRYVGDHVEAFMPGDLALLGSQLPHTWHSSADSEPSESVVIQFLPEFWGKAFESLPEMLRVNRLLAKADRGLLFSGPAARLAGQQMQSMQKMNPLERLTTFVLILDRLAGCRKVRTLASPTFAGMVRSQDRHRLDKLHAYIHQHFDQSIGLSDAAKVVAMNPTAFARYFRRMTGQSFVGYLQQLRVGHVCRQLIESDAPITDICYANGFGTLSNFNRVFARLKGCTPRDYRQQYTQSH